MTFSASFTLKFGKRKPGRYELLITRQRLNFFGGHPVDVSESVNDIEIRFTRRDDFHVEGGRPVEITVE